MDKQVKQKAPQLPKILLLSRSVPPTPIGTGIIVANLAKQFKRDEMVVVGSRVLKSPQIQWSDEWPEIKYGSITVNFRGARWIHWLQFPWLFVRVLSIAIVHKCKVNVVVYPHEIYLLVGYIVSRLLHIPLFPYIHNSYAENYPSSRFARWLETVSFRNAHHIFTISDGLKIHYVNKYPKLHFSSLVHTFNETIPDYSQIKEITQPLKLVFSGTINHSCSDALMRIIEAVKRRDNIRFNIYTGTPLSTLNNTGIVGGQFKIEKVSRAILLEKLKDADVLMLPHSFSNHISLVEQNTIFPTKTIEYLISGVPILAHIPEECFLWQFIKENKCAYLVDEPSISALLRGLDIIITNENMRADLVKNALITARQFKADNVVNHFRKTILDYL